MEDQGQGLDRMLSGTRLLRNRVQSTLANSEEAGKMNLKRRRPFGQLGII